MKSKKIIATAMAAVLCASLSFTQINAKKIVHHNKSVTRALKTSPKSNQKNANSSGNFVEANVVKVVDGDTIHVKIGSSIYNVRMVGVDTPETVHPKKPVQFYGKEASNYTKSQLTGKKVYLQKDVTDRDKYGRILRYVWLSRPSSNEPSKQDVINKMYNAQLVKNGYAHAYSYPPDVKYIPIFRELEANARNKNLGLWNKALADKFVPTKTHKKANPVPNKTSKPNFKVVKKPASLDTKQGVIKGNSKSKIYHLKGQQSYNRISEKNVVYFKTEKEAIAAGYRKALR